MKKLLIVAMIVCNMISFAGCGKKQECDWCGEVKKCQEFEEDGEIMAILCDDCIKEIKEDFL